MSHKTDWFKNKKWGVFIHLLDSLQNNPDHPANMQYGKMEWSDFIDSLDTEFLAEQLSQVNAGYLCITIMQRTRFLIAPNETFNRISGYKTGEACAKRDLINDLYESLSKRNIDLLLYFTGDGPLDDKQAGSKFGYITQAEKVSVNFVSKWAEVLEEYSKRYGSKVKAWWVDGCYEAIGYDELKLKIIADAIRAGNPDALVSLNCGVFSNVSAYSISDDFTTGEMNSFDDIPKSRFIGTSQWHVLSFLGIPTDGTVYGGWGRTGTKYTGEYMHDYVKKVIENEGVVTIDVCMYRDGHIDKPQYDVLYALRDLR